MRRRGIILAVAPEALVDDLYRFFLNIHISFLFIIVLNNGLEHFSKVASNRFGAKQARGNDYFGSKKDNY